MGGVRRLAVKRGMRLRIVVRSDVADEVHLHGYDRTRKVGPGAPAVIALDADLAGSFELELERRGLPLADLRVEP